MHVLISRLAHITYYRNTINTCTPDLSIVWGVRGFIATHADGHCNTGKLQNMIQDEQNTRNFAPLWLRPGVSLWARFSGKNQCFLLLGVLGSTHASISALFHLSLILEHYKVLQYTESTQNTLNWAFENFFVFQGPGAFSSQCEMAVFHILQERERLKMVQNVYGEKINR